jgi:hypothetical protein
MDETTIHVKENGKAFTFGCAVADACCGRSDTLPRCNGKQHNQDTLVLHLCEDILDHGVLENM